MSKGYFIHRVETVNQIPSNNDFIIVRAVLGVVEDANFTANWKKCGTVRKMVYQNPILTADNDIFKNAAHLVQSIQILQAWYGGTWKQNPIVVSVMNLGDILQVMNYVTYIWDHLLKEGDPKPLLYATTKKWNNLVNGPDAEIMALKVLNKAELIISEYGNIANPTLPLHVGKVRYWEYKAGFVEFQDTGKFSHPVETNDSGSTDSGSTPSGSTVAKAVIHTCPHCGGKLTL